MANTNGNQVLAIVDHDIIARNKANGFEDLDHQRKAFALSYASNYNHRDAAEEAGFPPGRGIKLIREPLVAALISHLQEETAMANFVTADFVRAHWLRVIPMLMGEEEVPHVLADGEEVSVKRFFPGELNNVLKELAKSTKFYEDGSGGGGNVNVNIDMGALLGGHPAQGVTIDHE